MTETTLAGHQVEAEKGKIILGACAEADTVIIHDDAHQAGAAAEAVVSVIAEDDGIVPQVTALILVVMAATVALTQSQTAIEARKIATVRGIVCITSLSQIGVGVVAKMI